MSISLRSVTKSIGLVSSAFRRAMNRGAFDFLTKPIDFLDLEATITKTLRHIEVLREARRRQAEAERAHAERRTPRHKRRSMRSCGQTKTVCSSGRTTMCLPGW
jgi:DNA-binding NtrC family response regulator